MTLEPRVFCLKQKTIQVNLNVAVVHASNADASLKPWESKSLPSSSDAKASCPKSLARLYFH